MKWSDVIHDVQKVHVQHNKNHKRRERQINQLFIKDAHLAIKKQQSQQYKRFIAKNEQKRIIDEQVKNRIQMQKRLRLQSLQVQKAYKQDNLKLMESRKVEGIVEKPKDYMFDRLITDENKRKQLSQQKYRQYMKINEIQQKIKEVNMNKQKEKEKQYHNNFGSYVQQFYKKKQEEIMQFKNRYIKILRSSKTQRTQNSQTSQSIQKQYEFFNKNIAQQKLGSIKKIQNLNAIQIKINKNIKNVDHSPAFLGTITNNHDRQKQLSFLERGVQKKITQEEGNDCKAKDVQIKKQQAKQQGLKIKQLPALKKYFNRNKSTTQAAYEIPTKHSQSKYQTLSLLHENSMNPIKYNTNRSFASNIFPEHVGNETRQIGQVQKNSKVYISYDIISGQSKYKFI